MRAHPNHQIPEHRLAPYQCHGYDHPCYLAHEICEHRMIGASPQRELAGQLPQAVPADQTHCPIYFLHIPKTGGTTFHEFIASQFPESSILPAHLWRELLRRNPQSICEYSFIWGHFYSYLARYVPCNLRYITVLRHPIERALSHYGHIIRETSHYLHMRAVSLRDFGGFLRDPITATAVTNFQVRSLTASFDPVTIAESMSVPQLDAFELEKTLETTTPSTPDHVCVEHAMHRLKQMCFVGITERMTESVAVLCRTFNWAPPLQFRSLNVSDSRLKWSELRADDRDLLMQLNAEDLKLYAFANELLDANSGAISPNSELRDRQV
jgi:Sulfotransferase family